MSHPILFTEVGFIFFFFNKGQPTFFFITWCWWAPDPHKVSSIRQRLDGLEEETHRLVIELHSSTFWDDFTLTCIIVDHIVHWWKAQRPQTRNSMRWDPLISLHLWTGLQILPAGSSLLPKPTVQIMVPCFSNFNFDQMLTIINFPLILGCRHCLS